MPALMIRNLVMLFFMLSQAATSHFYHCCLFEDTAFWRNLLPCPDISGIRVHFFEEELQKRRNSQTRPNSMFNFEDNRCKETEKLVHLALQQYYEPIMPMFISPNNTEIKCRCNFSHFFPFAPRECKHYAVRKLQSLGKRDVGCVNM